MQHAKNAYILAMLIIKSIYILLINNGLTDIINMILYWERIMKIIIYEDRDFIKNQEL